MRDPKRAVRVLDDVSDHMGEVLRRADELLVDWSRFGAEVRAQVDREALKVGHAVAGAVDVAVARATTAAVERSMADQIGAKLQTLSAEIVRLEARARAASRAVAEERHADRKILWGVVAGVAIANGLLVVMLLRKPAVVEVPARVETPVAAPVDAAVVVAPPAIDAAEPAVEVADKPVDPPADKPAVATKPAIKPATGPSVHPVKSGPPAPMPPRRR